MKHIKQKFKKLLFCLWWLTPTATFAGGDFLKNNFSARAVGLGNAYGVIVSDPSALYWNPAGLAKISGERVTLRKLEDVTKEAEAAFGDAEFKDLLEGEPSDTERPRSVVRVERGFELQWYSAAAAQSLERYTAFSAIAFTALGGTLGVGALGSFFPGIQGYDENGIRTSQKDYHAAAGYLGYAQERGALRWGLSFMGMNEGVASKAISGGGVNAGVQLVPIPIISAGLAIQNLVGAAQAQVDNQQKWTKLDTLLRFSLAITSPPPNSNLKLLLGFTSNLDKHQTEGIMLNLGLAYSLNNFSYVMVGVDNGNPAVGFGLVFKALQLAYAVNRDPLLLGLQHYLELNFAL